jgi:hypothetical protein
MTKLLDTKTNPTAGDLEGMGLSSEEQKIMLHLLLAMNRFSALVDPAPSTTCREEFAGAIHQCQHLLALRVVARDYPAGGWS